MRLRGRSACPFLDLAGHEPAGLGGRRCRARRCLPWVWSAGRRRRTLSLVTECAQCRKQNPAEARFCLACGSPLPSPGSIAREVRKTVTVVFSDVTGSTRLGEERDPESVRRVMGRYFEQARAALERHGGTVEKFIGDAVMAVFGIPTLHEDDALRAVRAAAELRERLADLNEELVRDWGIRLETRTAVNTGDVVTGSAETLVTGDAVNVAARLEQAAAPGEVCLLYTSPSPRDS